MNIPSKSDFEQYEIQAFTDWIRTEEGETIPDLSPTEAACQAWLARAAVGRKSENARVDEVNAQAAPAMDSANWQAFEPNPIHEAAIEAVARALFEAEEDLNDQAEIEHDAVLGPRTTWDDPQNAPILEAFRFRARAAIAACLSAWSSATPIDTGRLELIVEKIEHAHSILEQEIKTLHALLPPSGGYPTNPSLLLQARMRKLEVALQQIRSIAHAHSHAGSLAQRPRNEIRAIADAALASEQKLN